MSFDTDFHYRCICPCGWTSRVITHEGKISYHLSQIDLCPKCGRLNKTFVCRVMRWVPPERSIFKRNTWKNQGWWEYPAKDILDAL